VKRIQGVSREDAEEKRLDEAVKSERQSVALMTNQYKAGVVNYANLVTVQTYALTDERVSVEIHGRRLVASVQLIKALGGGWESGEIKGVAK
jgi:outer membrane protein TolC